MQSGQGCWCSAVQWVCGKHADEVPVEAEHEREREPEELAVGRGHAAPAAAHAGPRPLAAVVVAPVSPPHVPCAEEGVVFRAGALTQSQGEEQRGKGKKKGGGE